MLVKIYRRRNNSQTGKFVNESLPKVAMLPSLGFIAEN